MDNFIPTKRHSSYREGAKSRLSHRTEITEDEIVTYYDVANEEHPNLCERVVAIAQISPAPPPPSPAATERLFGVSSSNASLFAAAIRQLQEDPALVQRLLARHPLGPACTQLLHMPFQKGVGVVLGIKRQAEDDVDEEDAKRIKLDG
jgi:hypothetical protein